MWPHQTHSMGYAQLVQVAARAEHEYLSTWDRITLLRQLFTTLNGCGVKMAAASYSGDDLYMRERINPKKPAGRSRSLESLNSLLATRHRVCSHGEKPEEPRLYAQTDAFPDDSKPVFLD
ncbi:hypothetical protein A6R68_06270 [Neotoma lepida]|uniref:Uncharacterized protein n=1 Tax=Neotoma lepida TaxID=56216 RepID=A0A1A6GG28_NEOLE|nr:hypothetical protein A6R68_06270 [Neotoma lepida]